MTGQRIGNTGTIVLADALKHNTTLEWFDLRSETTHETLFGMNEGEMKLMNGAQTTQLVLKEQLH